LWLGLGETIRSRYGVVHGVGEQGSIDPDRGPPEARRERARPADRRTLAAPEAIGSSSWRRRKPDTMKPFVFAEDLGT